VGHKISLRLAGGVSQERAEKRETLVGRLIRRGIVLCVVLRCESGGEPPHSKAEFENDWELEYPLVLKNEDEAPRSYRSGKIGGVGVPGGGDASVGAVVGDGMAVGWNGVL